MRFWKNKKLWLFLIIFNILLAVALASMFYLNISGEQELAIEKGKRIVVTIPSGNVIGKSYEYFDKDFLKKKIAETQKDKKENSGETEGEEQSKTLDNKEGEGDDENSEDNEVKEDTEQAKVEEEKGEQSVKTDDSKDDYNGKEINIINASKDVASNQEEQQKQQNQQIKPIEKLNFNIILYNMGLNIKATKRAIQLPINIGLSFSAYSDDLQYLINIAKKKDKQCFIDLPLETKNYPIEDQGSLSLLTNQSEKENMLNLDIILNLANNYDGVIALPNETYTFAVASAIPMIDMINEYNKIFIFNAEIGSNSFLIDESIGIGLKAISEYKTINNNYINKQAITDMLMEYQRNNKEMLVKNAGADDAGDADAKLILLPAYPAVIEAIEDWLDKNHKANDKKIVLTSFENMI